MRQKRKPELSEVSGYPIRLYTGVEMAKLLRMSPFTWDLKYRPRLPPMKAGTHKTARAFWTDLDVVKAIDMVFPGLDLERRQFLYAQLEKGKARHNGSTEVS